jgi:hypothetical protein
MKENVDVETNLERREEPEAHDDDDDAVPGATELEKQEQPLSTLTLSFFSPHHISLQTGIC